MDPFRVTPAPSSLSRLYSAVVSDSLDALGYMHQAMAPRLRPLDESKTFIGRARTALYQEVTGFDPADPYGLEIEFVDSLQAGNVAILACGGSERIAPWGGLLSTAATARGATGTVTDGFVRDILHIRSIGYPVFHGGIAPLDSKGRGKLVQADIPVTCGGVLVSPGDLIIGDADGVVVIPRQAEDETLALAWEKVEGEDRSAEDLKAGLLLRDVFAKHGVL